MSENSSVFGLRHQARCLAPVTNSTENSEFLVGTVGGKENVVCLLSYDDDEAIITPTFYQHAEEVWDIVSCPTDKNMLFTCHSPVSGNPQKKRATLWKIPNSDNNDADNHSDDNNNSNDQHDRNKLVPLATLENEGIKKVLWDQQQQDRVVFIDSSNIYLSTLDNNYTSIKPSLSIDTSSIFSNDPSSPSLCQLQNAVLNPHNGYEVVVCGDRQLAGYDTRTNGNSFRMKGHAHESTVRAIDYNPNKPYHIATGGDDSLVRIWDSRNLTHHLMEIKQHTHWVWDVAFNKLQDQLLLTSSSDTLVSLYNTISVSSASYLENEDSSGSDEDDGSDDYDSYSKPVDGLICTYDQHEDSVYKVAWSPTDTWTFASISYAGRVVISQVPTSEKFKILGV